MLWLCLLSIAQAHVPHDVMEALAAPAALDDSKPWWAVLNVPGGALIVRSEDAGRTWDIQAADPIADDVTMMVMVEGEGDAFTLVAASTHAMWSSSDDGATWSRQAFDEHEIVGIRAFGGTVYVGTTDGIYTWTPTGLSVVEDSVIVAQMSSSADGVVVVDTGGGVRLHTADASGFRALGRPTGGASTGVAVSLDSGVGVLIGNEIGEVRLWDDGSWRVCDSLPPGDSTPDVVRLGAHGDTWLAANGTRAPFVSTDRCESWTSYEALDVIYSADGGAESVWQGYTAVAASDERWLVAGWGGIAISEDEGETWYQPGLVPVAFVRGLEIAPDYRDSGLMWVGAYAAGVILADEWGTVYSAPNHGLADRNVQSLAVDPGDPARVYTVAGHVYAASTDGGETWMNIDAVGSSAGAFAFASPTEVWVTGTTVAGGVLMSEDGVTEWTQPEGLAEAVGLSTADAVVRATSPEGRHTCVSAVEPAVVVCKLGDSGAWETRFSQGSEKVSALVAWPPGASNAWVVADETGIWRSTDLGESWTRTHETTVDRVRFIEQTGDGTLVGVTISGRVLRSINGGQSWTSVGLQVPGGPRAVVARTNFADHDQVFVGGPDGVYIVDDLLSGPNLRPYGGWEGLDSRSGFWRCSECPGILSIVELAVEVDGAWGDTVAWLETDMVAVTHLRAESIALRGIVPVGAALDVRLRDASTFEVLAETTIADVGDELGVLAEWSGLPGGWVELTVTVAEGEVGIDFAEAQITVEHVDGEDTGTGDGGATDGGTSDGGTADGGTTDGGTTDGGTGSDGGTAGDGGDTGDGKDDGCKGCAAGPASAGLLALLLPLVSVRRRRA